VNGLLFGRTTTTIVTARPSPAPTPIGSYGVIFHFDPNNVASTYTIDHMFAGHDAEDGGSDGDNPRHDAMTPFNGYCTGPRWKVEHTITGSSFRSARMARTIRCS
jgi:hypothetical protein